MRSTATKVVVLKFGGTSVATPARWGTIASILRERLSEGARPVVVCSALAGISNQLEKLVRGLVAGKPGGPALGEIRRAHEDLATGLELDAGALLAAEWAELERLAEAISAAREMRPRLHAGVLASGELMSTRLGAAYLSAQGIPTAWWDARTCLSAKPEPGAPGDRVVLSATCSDDREPELIARLEAEPADAVLTQGFIAGDAGGGTVLLGRGGSDTSAAYFAATLGAERCEIWTDVPGMFSANPHQVPSARLLRRLDYDEAQEIASTGATVLHPRSIPPVRRHRIPLWIRCTTTPGAPGTLISAEGDSGGARVKAISAKGGLTLVSMDTMGMWQQVGFLADAFARFKERGLSVDLVSTSEANVTVSLDPAANALDPRVIEGLLADLASVCRARAIGPCAAVSLVGRNIRGILHKLGSVLEVFEEQRIHLVSQAASDLNLTFVVDEDQAERLVRKLHALLFDQHRDDGLLGPTWRDISGRQPTPAPAPHDGPVPFWWRRSAELLALADEGTPAYVYDLAVVDEAAAALTALGSFDRVLYAVKANHHPQILRRLHAAGLGFDCVSPGEISHVLARLPGLAADRLLFTPNFAPRGELADALATGVHVTLDNLHPLAEWPEVFRGSRLFLRMDPGQGEGHHAHVRTAGALSKFGIAASELDELQQLLDRAGATVVGLHAHSGSGIRSSGSWARTARYLAGLADRFPELQYLDVGGGLGVPERPGQVPLDLAAVDASLAEVRHDHPGLEIWMEPGRFLVAAAGVLLARVTQIKRKGELTFVGVDAGMNSLIRPALYGAWHEIVNLSRLGEPPSQVANVVGPICETGDTLGFARRIAPAQEGDVLLIATAGAYGRVMSSKYNLREPAIERVLPPA